MPGLHARGSVTGVVTTPRVLVGEVVRGSRTQDVRLQLSRGPVSGERPLYDPWFAPSGKGRRLRTPREEAVPVEW